MPFSTMAKIFGYAGFVILLFRAVPAACESSQARGRTGAVAASLYHNHSNVGSKAHVTYTTAMPDLYPTERGQGSKPHPHGC